MKKIMALALSLMLAFSFAACGDSDTEDSAYSGPGTLMTSPDDEEGVEHIIKIGVFEPMTGENGRGGLQEILGIRYANAIAPTVELNGTVYRIALVEADNQSDKAAAITTAEGLIEEGVAGVIGSYGSGVSIAAGQTFADASVPAIGASCTNPQVTAGNNYYFRTCFLDTFQGTVMASYAADQGYKTAAIISQRGDDYSTGIAAYFKQAFTDAALGGTVVADEVYQTNESDFSELLGTVKESNPDCIFIPCSVATAELLLPQVRASGITAPIIASDTWENAAMVQAVGDAAEGAVFSTAFDESATPQAKNFVRGFQAYLNEDAQRIQQNGSTDSVAAVSALGYDAYMTMVTALTNLDGTKDKLTSVDLRRALTEVEYEGVCGDITFDKTGDANKDTAYLKKIQNGTFVFLKKQTDETE